MSKKATAAVTKRAKRRGVKMHSPERGRDSAVLPPLPMPFREALADYLKVNPDDGVLVLSKDDQRALKKAHGIVKRIRKRGK